LKTHAHVVTTQPLSRNPPAEIVSVASPAYRTVDTKGDSSMKKLIALGAALAVLAVVAAAAASPGGTSKPEHAHARCVRRLAVLGHDPELRREADG
jgi:hypothetical protein